MRANKDVLFDDWLKEHLADEMEEYKKEVFKLKLAIQMKEIRTEQQ